MHRPIQLFLAVCLLLDTLYSLTESQDCVNDGNFASRLTIDSARSEHGIWTSQIEFVHSDRPKKRGAWTSNIHQRTSKCGNDSSASGRGTNGFVALEVTLLGPRPSEEELGFGAHLRLRLGGRAAVVSLGRGARRWVEARVACRAHGGDLLGDVTGALGAAQRLLWALGVPRAFVGWRRDPQADHAFRTVAGDPVKTDERVHWAPGRPTTEVPLAQGACGSLAVERLLYDVSCDDPLPFFCQRILPPD